MLYVGQVPPVVNYRRSGMSVGQGGVTRGISDTGSG